VFAANSTAASAPQAQDYTFDQAKTAFCSIADRFGVHVAKEVLRFLGRETLSAHAPSWVFAELVCFSGIEANGIDEFRAALTADSIAFLEKVRPGGPWVLTAIVPDGKPTTTTANNPREAQAFIFTHNGQRNIYFSVNPTRTPTSEKAAKTDIAAIEYIFADLDPAETEPSAEAKKRYRAQLEKFEPRPTLVIDSGNGIQALWRLTVPIVLGEPVAGEDGKFGYALKDQAKIDDAEARNAAVMLQLNAKAGTQNIDRILRLPGTINLPNAKKKREGRVLCPTKLIHFEDLAYPFECFSPTVKRGLDCKKPKQGTQKQDPTIQYIKGQPQVDIASLPVSDKIKSLIRTDGGDYGKDGDRSAALMAVLSAMAAHDCTDEQMYAVMWHEPIGQHAREQADLSRYFKRQVDRAREFAARPDAAKEFDFAADNPNIAELNRNYALVLVGGRSAILRETDQEPGGYTLLSHSAFDHWFANRHVVHNNKRMTLSRYWLCHPDRRNYEGLVFAPGRDVPGYYNLWRGFAVAPSPGDCSKFLGHILDNVCQGNQELFDWLIGWFAQLVQQPEVKLGTAVVLRGKEGTGKSIFGKAAAIRQKCSTAEKIKPRVAEFCMVFHGNWFFIWSAPLSSVNISENAV
jgi:Mesyanzhinovviridae DNA primase